MNIIHHYPVPQTLSWDFAVENLDKNNSLSLKRRYFIWSGIPRWLALCEEALRSSVVFDTHIVVRLGLMHHNSLFGSEKAQFS